MIHFDGLTLLMLVTGTAIGYWYGSRRQLFVRRSRLANDARLIARARD